MTVLLPEASRIAELDTGFSSSLLELELELEPDDFRSEELDGLFSDELADECSELEDGWEAELDDLLPPPAAASAFALSRSFSSFIFASFA